MKYDVFISYSRSDIEIVNAFKQGMVDAGYSVWMDIDGIESGDEFKKKIVSAIKNSDVFLFFSSQASNSSLWTVKEVNVAVNLKKKIIPIKLDNAFYDDSLLFDLAGLDFIMYDAQKKGAAIYKLIRALGNKSTPNPDPLLKEELHERNSKPSNGNDEPLNNSSGNGSVSESLSKLKKKRLLALTVVVLLLVCAAGAYFVLGDNSDEIAEQQRLAQQEQARQDYIAEQRRLAQEIARKDSIAEQRRLAQEIARQDSIAVEKLRLAQQEQARQDSIAEQRRLAQEIARKDSIAEQRRLAQQEQARKEQAEQQRINSIISTPRRDKGLLCIAAVDKNSRKRVYFTGEEWESLSNDVQSEYSQLGISIRQNGHEFIIAAKDCGEGKEYAFGGYGTDFEGVKNSGRWDAVKSTFIDSGKSDTEKIIAQTCGKTDKYGIEGAPAAEAAWNYKANCYDNLQWYLPSISELLMIYKNKDAINRFLKDYFTDAMPIENSYWSSTEYDCEECWYVNMFYGFSNNHGRLTTHRVRPVAK